MQLFSSRRRPTSRALLPVLLPVLLVSLLCAQLAPRVRAAFTPRFNFGSKSSPIRGVNLGGWLVLEAFVAPSVFRAAGDGRVIDEWTYGQYAYGGNKTKSRAALRKHHQTFYVEADFALMQQYGINFVRIPIGYWAFGTTSGEPYHTMEQFGWLKQACGWASKYGIKVMVDLHGLKGSQNGFDHSGRKGGIEFQYNKSYQDQMVQTIRTMVDEFSKPLYNRSVAAIAVANEALVEMGVMEGWYKRVYNVIRGRSNIQVVFGDLFNGPDVWKGKFPKSQYQGVALESHVYTCFSDDRLMWDMPTRMKFVCDQKASYAARNLDSMPQILGEFSPAFTDCAVWLNGRGQGARYDGTYDGTKIYKGDCKSKRVPASQMTASYKRLLARYWQIQREVGEAGAGWIHWTWKTEASTAEEWSYMKGVQYGWIPKDLSKTLVSDTCAMYK